MLMAIVECGVCRVKVMCVFVKLTCLTLPYLALHYFTLPYLDLLCLCVCVCLLNGRVRKCVYVYVYIPTLGKSYLWFS